MNKNVIYQEKEWIEMFYDRTLSEQELIEFQQKIASDPVFAEEVDLFGYANEVTTNLFFPDKKQRHKRLKKKLFDPIEPPNLQPTFVRKISIQQTWVKIAAIFVLGISLFYLVDFYSAANVIVHPEQLAMRMVTTDGLRSSNSQRGQQVSGLLSNISENYRMGAYQNVLEQIEMLDVQQTEALYFDILLIKGVAAYYMDDLESALITFEHIVAEQNSHRDTALWWLVTIYQKKEKHNKRKTKENLHKIIKNNYVTANEATLLLENLEED